MIRVLIVDDHPVVRKGIVAMLSGEPDIDIIGEASNGLEAITRAEQLKPDIILMDLRMPEMDGVEAMNRIRQQDANIKFIVLTTYDTDEYIFKGIEAGARAYLLKDAPIDDVFKAINMVYRGESLIQPVVAGKLLDRFSEMTRQGQAQSVDALSDREMDVLRLLAKGLANNDIADDLSITESTVKSHVHSIFQKLGVSGRTEAVTEAIKRGLIRL
jgi:two-component system, NarL family, response regulator